MTRTAVKLASVILSGALLCAAETTGELRTFFREQMRLSDDQIATIARGKAIAKVLPSQTPAEIVVFGAVFVNATPEEYVKLALNVGRLQKSPGYLGIGRVRRWPVPSDLDGFTLEPEDIRDLRDCKPGKCGVQLPAEAMREIREGIDWARPDVASQVNDKMRKILLDLLRRYQQGGNSVLGTYRDKDLPFDVQAQLHSWLDRSQTRHIYLPQLDRYLLDYPNSKQSDIESLLYWEKVKFGMKPTLRLNHAIAYRSDGPRGAALVVAVKQLYASHYFQFALDLTTCVAENRYKGEPGFYLISLKASTQQGLTGFKGSILRRIVVGKTRYAQEQNLIGIKRALEKQQ